MIAVWVNSACLRNLLRMEFDQCGHLKSIPSLSQSNLVWMKISCCEELESVALLSLNNAAKLDINFCENLKSVTVSSLQNLKIQFCDELVSVHFESLATTTLKSIDISYCKKLESIPMISRSPFLETLSILYCQNLRFIGDSGSSFASSRCLAELTLCGVPNLLSIPRLDGPLSL